MDDDASTAPTAHARGRAQEFSERLYVAWWVWPLPLVLCALLAASVQRGYPALPAWLPYAVLLPVGVFVLLALSRATVRVGTADEPELRVADARLPLRFVGSVEVIGRENKRKALGPELDPTAYVVHRAWIGTALRIELTDPSDPTPYWLFSTRKPRQLERALGAHDAGAGTAKQADPG